MIICVCGSRDYTDEDYIFKVLDELPFEVTMVLEGGARGPDAISRKWAKRRGIPYGTYDSDWVASYSGNVRNSKMAPNLEVLVAFWDGVSTGTHDMINKAGKLGKTVITHMVGAGFLAEEFNSGITEHKKKPERTQRRSLHNPAGRRRRST